MKFQPLHVVFCVGMLSACTRDASFTKLADPEPPAEDTSTPPVEVDDDVTSEPDPECPDPGVVAATVATVDEDCRTEPPTTSFAPVIEWAITEFDTHPDFHYTSLQSFVGHFTDDNDDGQLGPGDIPDIATVHWDGDWVGNSGTGEGVLRLTSGDGTVEHWSLKELPGHPGWTINPIGVMALGDVDGDGLPEIVTSATNGRDGGLHRAVCISHDGSVEWVGAERSDEHFVSNLGITFTMATAADLDQDGQVEAWVGSALYDGRTGDIVWDMEGSHTIGVVVMDLDGDGAHELVHDRAIYEADLTERCLFGTTNPYSAIADLDGDGVGEIVRSGARRLEVFDAQCRLLLAQVSPDGGSMGPATVADFDGDGIPEIGLASASHYYVYEADGTERWRQPTNDFNSSFTGSSVYDFEGDGYAEVVYADEQSVWIFSGIDGQVRMQDRQHLSGTGAEYHPPVDVDADGQVEIVVSDANGIRVVGDRRESWVPGREVWNQNPYFITNVNDDLTIPTYQRPNWPEYNSFRSGDIRVNNGEGATLVDAFPMEVDRCELECGAGIVQLTIRGANQGLADARDGIAIALYAEQEDGSRTVLETIPADAIVRSSYTTEGYTLRLEMTDLPTGTLILVADDDGTGMGVIEECDETNNELRLEGLCSDE
jgi:hypothetical protein